MLSSICLIRPLGASVRSCQFSKDGRRVTNMKIGRLMVVWVGTFTKICSLHRLLHWPEKPLYYYSDQCYQFYYPFFFFGFAIWNFGYVLNIYENWFSCLMPFHRLTTSTQLKCLAYFTYFACLSNCWVVFPSLANWCPLCWGNITRFVSCNNEMRSKPF